jgi:hypothetical protein
LLPLSLSIRGLYHQACWAEYQIGNTIEHIERFDGR